jgi:hypothetical protein
MIPLYGLMLVLFVYLMTLRLALKLFVRISCIEKLSDVLYGKLFWNTPLKFLIEGYLALTLQSLSLMNKGLNWITALNTKENVFVIIALSTCSFAPLIMTMFFIRHFTQFRDKKFLLRFSSVIGELNWRYKWSSMFIFIFCYRRLILSLLIVFLPTYPSAQVQLITLTNVFAIIIFTWSNVYQTSKKTILEFFNEAIILICCYHMFCFTDFVDNPTIRFNIGYSLITFTTLNLGINVFVMIIETFKNLFRKCKICKICCQKCHNRKRLKKMKER